MQGTTCSSCRIILQARLKHAIVSSKQSRRSLTSKSLYWDTVPPTDRQLAAARWFFQQHPPRKLWTATEWRTRNNDTTGVLVPEVIFFGRSNVGKSSLLNAVLDSPALNRVGPHPGKTKLMHAWGLCATDPATCGALKGWKGLTDTRMAVLDAPGYGYGSASDWGAEIVTYLKRRKQLRRVFILIDSMHGPKKHDQQMLKMLREMNIPHQLIVSKIDRTKSVDTALLALQDLAQPRSSQTAVVGLGEILAVGGLDDAPRPRPSGVHDVQWAVLRATGLDEFAVDNYMRLSREKAMSHSDAPREANAQSHLGKPEVLPSIAAAPTPAESDGPRPQRLNSAPKDLRAFPVIENVPEPLRTSREVDTAPPTPLNPNVSRGMAALEEAVGLKPAAAKPRARAANSRPGSADSRSKPEKVKEARQKRRASQRVRRGQP